VVFLCNPSQLILYKLGLDFQVIDRDR
jgi:hypothetical protein